MEEVLLFPLEDLFRDKNQEMYLTGNTSSEGEI